jgi:hypothetical protein
MKFILTLIGLFIIPQILMAASTIVNPFSLDFYVIENRFSVYPKVLLSCRYEKIIFGDSSEYITETKAFDLNVERTRAGENIYYKINLKDKKRLDVNGPFKPTKECMSELQINFVDNNYSVGWAGQTKRPISFMLRSKGYFKAGDTQPDFKEMISLIDFKNLDFLYKSVPGLQVNIWMTGDDKKLPISPTSAAINAETNMPYRLEAFTPY